MTNPLSGVIGSRGSSGSAEVSKLARELHLLGPANRRSLSKRFREISQPLLADARRRAGWSTRIPDALSTRVIVNSTKGQIGVQLRSKAAEAPHARPYEGITQQGSQNYFRHPVFGDLETWVPQRTRPFMGPAVAAMAGRVRREVLAAFEEAARAAGFR